jgi:hypothetical protein
MWIRVCATSPSPRKLIPTARTVAQSGIDACAQLQRATEQPKQIRKAIEIADDLIADLFASFPQANHTSFSEPANRASQIVIERFEQK